MNTIQTLLFDLDGTLVDSRADLSNAVNHALKATRQPEQFQVEIVPHVGNGLRVLLSEVMGPVSDEILESAILAFSDFYADHCVDHTVLYADVAECLREFHLRLKIGVVTNKPEVFAKKIIQELGVGEYVSVIVGGDTLPEKKPHPAPVLKAVSDLGGISTSALVVGDGAQDIMAGQSAGVLTCLARYGYGFHPDFAQLKPDFQINNFKEIKEIVS